jgi:uncharacterized protein (TIGR03083 family)
MSASHTHAHEHDALDASDYGGLLHYMNHRLAHLGASLTAEQWIGPSLCDGWRACDVFGHMTFGGITPMPKVVALIALKYRGNVEKGSRIESIKLADSMTQAELVHLFEQSCEQPRGLGKKIPAIDLTIDHVVRELDIRRAQSIPGSFELEVLVGALGAMTSVSSRFFAPAKVAGGLRLRAVNAGWTTGPADGPAVEGPAEDLLLAVSGRRAGLAGLRGDGVDELRRRIAA